MDRLLFFFVILAGIVTLRGDNLGFNENDTNYKTWFSGISDESVEYASVEDDDLAGDTEFSNRQTDQQITNNESMQNKAIDERISSIDNEKDDTIPETKKLVQNISNRVANTNDERPILMHRSQEDVLTDNKQLSKEVEDYDESKNQNDIERGQIDDFKNDQVNFKENAYPENDVIFQQNLIKNEDDYDNNMDLKKDMDKSEYEWGQENEEYYDDDIDQIKDDLNKDIDQLVATIKKLVNDENVDTDKIKNMESNDSQEEQLDLKDFNEVNEDIKELFMDQEQSNLNLVEVDTTAQSGLDKEDYILRLRQDIFESENNDEDYNIDDIDSKNEEKSFDYGLESQEDEESQDALVFSEIKNALNEIHIPENEEQNLLMPEINDGILEDENVVDQSNVSYVRDKNEDFIEENESTENLTYLINQFKIDHQEELDMFSEDFENFTPVIMRITFDNPLMISSPNYPEPYPPSNTVDWIFEGVDGTGIEFNLTDLDLNGEAGDFLLIRPGSIDDTDSTGLVFTYTLKEHRNYRFYDYDTMFVRFHSESDINDSHRGFTFSVKFIEKIEEETEELGQDEEVLVPLETVTVYVGGVTPQQFLDIAEDFRLIIADMATLYTNQHSINVGNNTMSDVTRITSVSVCNLNWPHYESCVAVRFGVALSEMEEDYRLSEQELSAMWLGYSTVDPFAARLMRLGVMEFAIPNDSAVLVSWVGVMMAALVLAALCGFFCWRRNCFDDYTRMSMYSGADLLSQGSRKSALSLYPTPHQTLPPLYEEPAAAAAAAAWHDDLPPKYSDTTQVDMSGAHANQAFDKSDMLSFDSDDDIIMSLPDSGTPKNTTSSMRPKDLFEV